jgi:hypothetical protein
MANHQARKPQQLSLPFAREASPRFTGAQHHQVVLLLAQLLLSAVPPASGGGAAAEAGDEPR